MYFNDYIKVLSKNNNKLSINFDNHFYLQQDKENIENYQKTYKIWEVIVSKLFNFVLNIYNYDEIEGHPNIPPEIIELGFVFFGGVAIAKDAVGDIEILPATPTNKINKYGRTDTIRVIGFNGYTAEYKQVYEKKDFKNKTCIFIEDNDCYFLTSKIIYNYSESITDKLRALEIATQKLKKPFIFLADKKRKNDLKEFYKNFENNKPLIILTDAIDDNTTELQDYSIDPDNVKAIKESILFDISQFLEIFGINTDPNPDKMERKLVDEINSNNDYLNILGVVRTKQRKKLIKKAKEICGLDIKMINNMELDEKKAEEKEKEEKKENANTSTAQSIQKVKKKTK